MKGKFSFAGVGGLAEIGCVPLFGLDGKKLGWLGLARFLLVAFLVGR